jgi:hypothetical protein
MYIYVCVCVYIKKYNHVSTTGGALNASKVRISIYVYIYIYIQGNLTMFQRQVEL